MKALLAFPLTRLLLIILLWGTLVSVVLLRIHTPRVVDSIWWTISISWTTATILLVVLLVVERLTTGRTPSEVGFNPQTAIRDVALGITIGAVLFSAVVAELGVGGYYHVMTAHLAPEVALVALLLLADALTEELLFRGVVFRLVEEWAGTWVALAVSAITFGAVHAANPGATWISTVAIALEAGVLLAAAYVVTKNLWLPIALHFAWNFFEGPIFGTQISGHNFFQTVLGARMTGPAWITGGSFGPEAGLPAIVTCLVAAVALLVYAQRTGLIVPPNWRGGNFYKKHDASLSLSG